MPVRLEMMAGPSTKATRGDFHSVNGRQLADNINSVTPLKANYAHAANVPLGELKL